MATPQAIIKSSLRKLNVIASGETMSAELEADGLEALNDLLDSINTEGLIPYATSRITKTLTATDNNYSIGTGGDINTVQPTRIDRATVIPNGSTYEYPLDVLTSDQWAAVVDKTATGTPSCIYFQKGITSSRGTIYLYPIPTAADTLVLYIDTQLTQIATADLTTDYVLPQGYRRMLKSNLAVFYATEFGLSISAELAAEAIESKTLVKRMNVEPLNMRCDDALLGHPQYDITTGDMGGGGGAGYGN